MKSYCGAPVCVAAPMLAAVLFLALNHPAQPCTFAASTYLQEPMSLLLDRRR